MLRGALRMQCGRSALPSSRGRYGPRARASIGNQLADELTYRRLAVLEARFGDDQ